MRLFSPIILFFAAFVLAGCSTTPKGEVPNDRDERRISLNPFSNDRNIERKLDAVNAKELYASAKEALDRGDPTQAIKLYEEVDARFPFSRYATQAQLDSIYAHFRAYDHDLALATARRFLKLHPRHPRVDYVYYVMGVINFERSRDEYENLLQVDSRVRDPVYARRSFEDFSLLIKRFPKSKYGHDAQQRMVYLKNGLARYELHVANYYLKRRAWIAANRRAQSLLESFQGTDSVAPALDILARSSERLGLDVQAREARLVLATNYPNYDGVLVDDDGFWRGWFNKSPVSGLLPVGNSKPEDVAPPPAAE